MGASFVKEISGASFFQETWDADIDRLQSYFGAFLQEHCARAAGEHVDYSAFQEAFYNFLKVRGYATGPLGDRIHVVQTCVVWLCHTQGVKLVCNQRGQVRVLDMSVGSHTA
jgi:hypothetical protein